MDDVPAWSFHSPSSLSRVVISKAVNNDIPDRLIVFYKESLRQRNPHGNYDEVAGGEVFQPNVPSQIEAIGVLVQSTT